MKNNTIFLHPYIKRIVPLLCVCLVLAGLIGCEHDSNSRSGSGKLLLTLQTDTTFRKNVSTKSDYDYEEEFADFLDVNEYAITISKNEEEVLSYDTYEKVPEEVTLPVGAYTLLAYKGENLPAAFENPYFAGSVNFLIEADMRTLITDTCRLANTRVTVDYTEDFLQAYPDHKVYFSTAYMDSDERLTFDKEEYRPAYFRSEVNGTDLSILLELVKLNTTEPILYEPKPISIEPRENVSLLFKTDGNALNGIGLEVTINKDLEEETLNMEIPEYAWGDSKFLFGTANFNELVEVSYYALKQKEEFYYLDYTVPGAVATCILTISKDETEQNVFDLTTAEGLAAAKTLGISITDQANSEEYATINNTKRGRIHFTDLLANLPVSAEEVTYVYKVEITDALPISSTKDVSMSVKPVTYSEIKGENVADQTIAATANLSDDITITYLTDIGIEEAILKVKRNGIDYETYNVLGALPEGISYINGILTFDKSFVNYLEVEPIREEKYTFVLEATDKAGNTFKNSPMEFTITLTSVFEIVVPTVDIWGWKAKAMVNVSGLTEQNKSNLDIAVSNDKNTYVSQSFTIEGDYAVAWLQGLTPGKTHYVKAAYNNEQIISYFETEEGIQVENGDMDTWWLDSRVCMYGGATSLTRKNLHVPYPVLGTSNNVDKWTSSNSITAQYKYDNTGGILSATKESDIPKGCFPSVVFEKRNDGFVAVIRSIDASAKDNGKARGELIYENTLVSRPSSISFDYFYEPINNEIFISDVFIYSENEIIGQGVRPAEASANTDYENCTIPVLYKEELSSKKATNIKIFFASTDKEEGFSIKSTTSSISAPDPSKKTGLVDSSFSFKNFSGVKHGSTLKIDNVQLNYTGQ